MRLDALAGKDIRGRHPSQDIHDFITAMRKDLRGSAKTVSHFA
jgi:hypothetical protein